MISLAGLWPTSKEQGTHTVALSSLGSSCGSLLVPVDLEGSEGERGNDKSDEGTDYARDDGRCPLTTGRTPGRGVGFRSVNLSDEVATSSFGAAKRTFSLVSHTHPGKPQAGPTDFSQRLHHWPRSSIE